MLKHLPLLSSYFDTKKFELNYYEGDLSHSYDRPRGIVAAIMADGFYDDEIEENGMEKFVVILCTSLFEIKHNDLSPTLATTMIDLISEFETGKFNDLFSADELSAINSDIEAVKTYLAAHPELLED